MVVNFNDERPKRQVHGDVLLRVEAINPEEMTVSGSDFQTGEFFTIALATPEEAAKHFTSNRDQHRPFAERMERFAERFEKRPPLFPDEEASSKPLSIEVGSVVRFENVRTFETPEGTEKTAASWPRSIVRDPTEEVVLTGTVQATHYETSLGQRIDVTVVKEDAAQSLKDFDLDSAFSGSWDDLPLKQTGVVLSIRNASGEVTTSNITTPYRKYAEPSLEAALDAPQGTYQVYAAAVLAAKTGLRTFDDLKISGQVNPKRVEIAREIYNAIAENPENPPFEIAVMPTAKTQFIPGDSLKNFMKDYHGTPNGKAREGVTPDPVASYQNKGFAPSILGMSRDPKSPDVAPASTRVLMPDNKFTFAEINVKEGVLPRKMREIGQEAAVRVFGETFGSTAPSVEMDAKEPAKESSRKKSFDTAPTF
jgi:hypothetical protein